MKKILLLAFFFGTFAFVFKDPLYAQTRGEGVGALATRTTGGTTITVSNGKTAPWSEIIVEDASTSLVAAAEIDSRGIFNFTFNTDVGKLGSLYLYGVDEVGNTSKIQINDTNPNNILLAPTIIGVDDPNLPDNSLSIYGFAYKEAEVRIDISSNEGYQESITQAVDAQTGRWSLQVDDLPAGTYVAKAKSFWGGLESIYSQELTFEIKGIAVLVPIADVYKNITQNIEQLPEPIKETANVVSKVGAPVATSWFFLQVLLTGMSLKDIFTYLLIFYFWLMGFLSKRRRKERWGVLYDAVTKNPVARGIVRLYREPGGLIETDVTGNTGAFSFLPPQGNYRLSVRKPGYDFPSKLVRGVRDGEYTPAYHGEIVGITKERPVIALNIPVDPKVYEKEFRGRLKAFFNKYSGVFTWFLFVPGFILSFIAYTVNPNILNILVMSFYIFGVAIILFRSISTARMWGVVVGENKQPVGDVSLSLLDTILGRQLQRRVTDLLGRYQFVVPSGKYLIKITSPGYAIAPGKGYYSGEEIVVFKEKEVIKKKIAIKKM